MFTKIIPPRGAFRKNVRKYTASYAILQTKIEIK